MRDLGEACEELLSQLEVFQGGVADDDRADAGLVTVTFLIAEADTDPGLRRRGQMESRPPWNAVNANALLEAHQLVRRLEASLRIVVLGHAGHARGGSDANTLEAIRAISRMATAASVIHTGEPVTRREPDGRKLTAAELAARILDRMTRLIGQLPAVDEVPRWDKIRAGPDGLPPRCPNCGTFSLRVAVQSGIVACFMPNCVDLDGNRPPQARLDMSKLNGEPVLAWADGTVQAAPRLPGGYLLEDETDDLVGGQFVVVDVDDPRLPHILVAEPVAEPAGILLLSDLEELVRENDQCLL